MGIAEACRQPAADVAAQLELEALERMLSALCAHVEQLAEHARARGMLESREADLQWQVFAERRSAARRLLERAPAEPRETRAARLQKHVHALDCSRAFFGAARGVAD